ncbi:aldo/keto reductase [Methanobrevibacter sp.]|uniref:aldo/keto reductase n=1 Tax=Methanobrevibacter sp. TaxID=66852 RepID=UPI0026E10E08|nr:aldo/keto reductase [Methanobrevibacter sp.]
MQSTTIIYLLKTNIENMMQYGFGAMRLPQKDETDFTSIDEEEFEKMVETYMDSGYSHFDTAYPYHDGASEKMIRKYVVEKYPRDSFTLANKMPSFELQRQEDLDDIFNLQLERCGVDYFDYYMLHNVSTWTLDALRKFNAYDHLVNLKREGKAKHIGISLHDNAEILEEVLKEMPEIEFVLLQINYLDWENESVQSRECYEIARKYGKDIMIMEPMKGGTLAELPEDISEKFKQQNPDISIPGWALKFCLDLDGVITVLSGTSNLEQLEDNLNTMKHAKPLDDDERELIAEAVEEINQISTIPCTQCNYCINECPQKIPIPTFFELYNIEKRLPSNGWSPQQGLYRTYAMKTAEASDCTACGACIEKCPQHLDIPEYMEDIVELFHNEFY